MLRAECPDDGVETVGCPLCGRTDLPVALEEHGWTGRRCAGCDVIFVSPRPKAERVASIYRHDEARVGSSVLGGTGTAARLRARMTLRIVGRHARGGRLLELGSGDGSFLREARRRGFDPRGIEINPVQADRIRALGFPCDDKPLSRETAPRGSLDVLYHCDVVSHLNDPQSDLRVMRELLAPRGVLVFETGNIPDVAPDRLGVIPEYQYPDHLYFFGERALRALLERAGFETVEVRRYAIGPQWRLMAFLGRLVARRRARAGAPSKGGSAPAPAGASRWKRARRAARDAALHVVRYGVGRLLARDGEAMTLIVVARPAAS